MRTAKAQNGFTLIEALLSLLIIFILTTILISSFVVFRRSQSLDRDTELVAQLLNQARSQTLSSKNASQYGVHIGASEVTLFTGQSYSPTDPQNQTFQLSGPEISMAVSLNGGGNNVVFEKLSGETRQNGTVTVTSSAFSHSRTITIYATGIIEEDQ